MRETGCHRVFTELSCAIGSPNVDARCVNSRGQEISRRTLALKPADRIREFGLDKPTFARRCRKGLFHDIH